MTIKKSTYFDSFSQFLWESEHSQEHDYYALAQIIRTYVGDVKKQESSEHGKHVVYIGDCSLTITRRLNRDIASMKLMGPAQDVEIFGIYHHGAEELFLLAIVGMQEELQEPRMVLRSLRHRSDETIKQSMRWFLSVLLTGWEACTP
jgi:hypothetical protein